MAVAVEKPDGKNAYYTVKAAVRQGRAIIDLTPGISSASARTDLIREAEMDARVHAHRYVEVGDQALVWKMPAFDLEEAQVDQIIERARKRKALILDLRGNGGGAESTMLRLVGGLFDRDLQVGELRRRNEAKPLVAKTRGANAFKGQLVVLVDSDTGSAAEVLARVVQLEKRGTVIGDKTSGSVRRGRPYDHQVGAGIVYAYGALVTDAELLLADGHSLEGVGVTPDELMLPRAADLASQKDPVLARAAELVGLQLSPEKAGAIFPVEWRK
jgi:C-terminal processing protease CtpA/Prc